MEHVFCSFISVAHLWKDRMIDSGVGVGVGVGGRGGHRIFKLCLVERGAANLLLGSP